MNTPTLSPDQVQRAMHAAARCDATVTAQDWLRAHRYHENWSGGMSMAQYDNGAGDHVIAFFAPDGRALIKGFDHESEVSPHAREQYAIWPGIYDGVPSEFLSLLQDEAAEYDHVTFCCWSEDGQTWKTGSALIPEEMDDGSDWLLDMVQMDADAFIDWATYYYGANFDLIGADGVVAAFGLDPSTAAGAAQQRTTGGDGA